MDAVNDTQSGAEKTEVAQAADADATLLGTTVKCPVCDTENAPSEKYCGDCGFLLSATPGEEAPAYDASLQPRLVDAATQREYLLHEGENVVGREAADVLLADPTVSRRHAVIILDGGKCWIEDSGSTNGTFVGDAQIQPGERVELSEGVEVKFGSAVLSLTLPAQTEIEEPAEAEETAEAAAEEVPPDAPEFEAAEAVEPVGVTEVEEVEAPSAEAAPLARLVSATEPSTEFAVMPGSNTIGRGTDNDIALSEDPYVSGSHAELIADERGFWLVDVGSTNGTVLNGSKIEPNTKMALNPGDEVIVGQTTFKFEVPEQATEGESSDE